MARRRFPFFLKFCLGLVVIAAIAWLSSGLWLPWVGYALIHNDGPVKADMAVVLAGDYFGRRLERAAELVKQGFVPVVLISGPPGYYGNNEADLAFQFIVHKGYPAQWFIPFPDAALSTRDEAGMLLTELRRRNVHSFLLVTSDFHSARAGRLFRSTARDMGYAPEMHVVTAPDEYFNPGSWWKNRESQKTVFFEWTKTIATAMGK